jgi:hypothetical protein
MKSKISNILLIIILLASIYISILGTINASEPIIENINYSPENPAPGSTVTFNATVIGDNISVYLFVEECKDDVCFIDPPPQNVTMQKIAVNKYQANVTLKHEKATMVHYQIIVESNGNWYKSELEEFNLSVKEDHATENNTPGFEFVYLAISVVFILLLYKRKMLK